MSCRMSAFLWSEQHHLDKPMIEQKRDSAHRPHRWLNSCYPPTHIRPLLLGAHRASECPNPTNPYTLSSSAVAEAVVSNEVQRRHRGEAGSHVPHGCCGPTSRSRFDHGGRSPLVPAVTTQRRGCEA